MSARSTLSRSSSSFPSICLALGLLVGAGCGDSDRMSFTSAEVDAAAQRLHELYAMRDYEAGAREGERWVGMEALEPRALHLVHLARFGDPETAVDRADRMVEEVPESAWSWYALAGALRYHRERRDESLSASLKALDRQPDDPRFVALHAEVLRNEEGNDASLEYLDGLPPELQDDGEMLVRRAVAHYFEAGEHRDEPEVADAQRGKAFEIFERARTADPANVNAWFLHGAYLVSQRRIDEAMPLLEKALELSPHATDLHQSYWRAIMARQDIEMTEKKALIQTDIEELLAERGDYPGTLLAAANQYDQLEMQEEREAVQDRILEIAPRSVQAEWVLVNRYRDVGEEYWEAKREGEEPDAELETRYRRMLESFIDRPEHRRETLLGDAYRYLFHVIKDGEDVDPAYLWEVADGVVKHEGINLHVIHAQVPVALADHGTHLREAEQIARDGFPKAEEQVAEYREGGLYDTEGDAENSLNWYKGMFTDAIGWVYFKQGRVEEAEEQLLEAYDLHPDNPETAYHLGQLYESTGDLEEAEEFYIKGANVQRPGDNPNDEALKALYVKRNGSEEGYEEYLGRIDEIDAARRKEEILAARIEDPEAMEPFALKELQTGEIVPSESFAGKILAINFWGTWCGPCVVEMPEFQEFHERYRDDSEVVVLTINNDTNPDIVAPWMEEKEYDFDVLLDDGYVTEVGVHAFPTTWFVDRDGRIAFIKEGWSESLAQEFGWRVEALRGAR